MPPPHGNQNDLKKWDCEKMLSYLEQNCPTMLLSKLNALKLDGPTILKHRDSVEDLLKGRGLENMVQRLMVGAALDDLLQACRDDEVLEDIELEKGSEKDCLRFGEEKVDKAQLKFDWTESEKEEPEEEDYYLVKTRHVYDKDDEKNDNKASNGKPSSIKTVDQRKNIDSEGEQEGLRVINRIRKGKHGKNDHTSEEEENVRPPQGGEIVIDSSPKRVKNDDSDVEEILSDSTTYEEAPVVNEPIAAVDPNEFTGIEINLEKKRNDEPSVLIPSYLGRVLKGHQLKGIRFLWRNIVQEKSGCILAHAMGLGKTLQSIAFLHTLLRALETRTITKEQLPRQLHGPVYRIMLLCPPIVLDNWQSEYKQWIPERWRAGAMHRLLPIQAKTDERERLRIVKEWHRQGGVLMIGYALLRRIVLQPEKAATSAKGASKEQAYGEMKRCIVDANLVIADEGHVIKNTRGRLRIAVKQFKTPLRICLTGTPLQNNLEEYWCMTDFVKRGVLGDLDYFREFFYWPIERGQYRDASEYARKLAAMRLFMLTKWIDPIVSRLDQDVLYTTLEAERVPKHEYVLCCRMSPLQSLIYDNFLDARGRVFGEDLFPKTIMLSRIMNHPAILKIGAEKTGYYDEDDEEEDEPQQKQDRTTNTRIMEIKDWAGSYVRRSDLYDLGHSHKMSVAFQLMKAFKKAGEKTLLFSRSIPTLDYIEGKLVELSSELKISYFRMDGGTANEDRQEMIQKFNKRDQERIDLFLISTMTGSLGINLTRANRVILLDVGWNPTYDDQAIARAFRFGQTRPVYVYRLQCYGTIDERLYRLNVHKSGISKRVVDRQNIEKHFTKDEITNYFSSPRDPEEDDTINVKADLLLRGNESTGDKLLDEMLILGMESSGIVKWFHHQSLLEDLKTSELTNAEIQQANAELEVQKNRPKARVGLGDEEDAAMSENDEEKISRRIRAAEQASSLDEEVRKALEGSVASSLSQIAANASNRSSRTKAPTAKEKSKTPSFLAASTNLNASLSTKSNLSVSSNPRTLPPAIVSGSSQNLVRNTFFSTPAQSSTQGSVRGSSSSLMDPALPSLANAMRQSVTPVNRLVDSLASSKLSSNPVSKVPIPALKKTPTQPSSKSGTLDLTQDRY